jgi:hypothetical protein
LIPSLPPREAIEARRKSANERFRGEYVHTIPQKKEAKKEQRQGPSTGYRPGRRKKS